MPIQFACPGCGKQTTVADQYAGQSGPCAQCGKQVTVPFAAGPAAYPGYKPAGPSGGGTATSLGVIVIVVLAALGGIVLVCGGIGAAVLIPLGQKTREASRRMMSQNNMKQIVIALHNYHDDHNALPPAVVKDANGQPLYSGMVLLLPYLDQQSLYDRFQKDKAWNDPTNLSLSGTSLPIFQDPANPNTATDGHTDYLLVSGPRSILEDAPGVKRTFGEITDGTSNTIVMVEVRGNTSWAAPITWDLNQPFDGNHPEVVVVGFMDGSVRSIRRDIDRGTLRRLVEKDDGEAVPLDY